MSAPKNALYRSKTSQNDLIDIIHNWIKENIVNEISKRNYLVVLPDEAGDCSNIEQLSLVIRYVDGQCELKEDFILFFLVKRACLVKP